MFAIQSTKDKAVPFSQLKFDWKVTEGWLTGRALPFIHFPRPFSQHSFSATVIDRKVTKMPDTFPKLFSLRSVDWMARLHPVDLFVLWFA